MALKRKQKWFIKVRGSYLPNNSQGWLTYIPYLAYLIAPLVFVLNNNYSVWLSIFIIVPNWIAAAAIMNWVASKTS